MVLLLLGGGLLASVAYIVGVCVYRLFFHPLSGYPGPILSALTDWYPAYYAWKGGMLVAQTRWQKKYGNAIRQGPNSLIFFTQSANGQIYGVRSNVSKSEGYLSMSPSRTMPNLINAVNKDVHSFKRRIIGQVMTDQSMKAMEPRIFSHIRGFVAMMGSDVDVSNGPPVDEGWTTPKDIGVVADWLTFDVISDLIRGKPLGLLESREHRDLPPTFSTISQLAAACLIQPAINRFKIDRLLLSSRRQRFRNVGTWLSKMASDREALGKDIENKDIFHYMINTVDSKTGQQFTRKDMWVESMLLLSGGSDTTSSAMSAVMQYLLHSPEWLAAITNEVRGTFSSEEEIILGPKLSSCEVTAASITETLRLTPTAPSAPPRDVLAGGITIDGDHLPEGTVVSAPIYHLQRDPSVFESPHDFQPDRWIVGESRGYSKERVEQQQKAYMPFSVGPRSCVGWRLARMELDITIARMLFRYDVKLAPKAPCCAIRRPDEQCVYKTKAWMVIRAEGPVVQFRQREVKTA